MAEQRRLVDGASKLECGLEAKGTPICPGTLQVQNRKKRLSQWNILSTSFIITVEEYIQEPIHV